MFTNKGKILFVNTYSASALPKWLLKNHAHTNKFTFFYQLTFGIYRAMSADCTNKKRSYANRRILEVQFKNQYARAFSEAHHLLLTNNEIPGYFFHS